MSKTRAYYVERGYADMARDRTWRLADCPYTDGWQSEAWQTGAWRWMCEYRHVATPSQPTVSRRSRSRS